MFEAATGVEPAKRKLPQWPHGRDHDLNLLVVRRHPCILVCDTGRSCMPPPLGTSLWHDWNYARTLPRWLGIAPYCLFSSPCPRLSQGAAAHGYGGTRMLAHREACRTTACGSSSGKKSQQVKDLLRPWGADGLLDHIADALNNRADALVTLHRLDDECERAHLVFFFIIF